MDYPNLLRDRHSAVYGRIILTRMAVQIEAFSKEFRYGRSYVHELELVADRVDAESRCHSTWT